MPRVHIPDVIAAEQLNAYYEGYYVNCKERLHAEKASSLVFNSRKRLSSSLAEHGRYQFIAAHPQKRYPVEDEDQFEKKAECNDEMRKVLIES